MTITNTILTNQRRPYKLELQHLQQKLDKIDMSYHYWRCVRNVRLVKCKKNFQICNKVLCQQCCLFYMFWNGQFSLHVVDQDQCGLMLTGARVYFIIPTFTCLWLPRSPGCSAHSGSFLLFLSSDDLLATTCLGPETTFEWRTKCGQKWIIVLWKLLGQWSRQPGQPTAAGSAQSIWNFGRLAWEPNFLQPGENTAFH